MGSSFKKFISVLCVLSLLIGLVPSSAFAAPDRGAEERAAEAVSGTVKTESGGPEADRSVGFSPKTSAVGGENNPYWQALQTAIDSAADGATIALDDLLHLSEKRVTAGSGNVVLHIDGDKSLTIDLQGYTIDRDLSEARSAGHVIEVNVTSGYTVTIKGPGTITGGKNSSRCGGIFVTSGKLTLSDGVKVTGNETALDGGGICSSSGGDLTVSGCEVTNNKAGDNGGGIDVYGNLTLSNSMVTNNQARNGGGIYAHSSELDISRSWVSRNTASTDGGGIYSGGSCDINLTGSYVTDNMPYLNAGSGIYMTAYDTLALSESLITDDIYLPEGKTIQVDEVLEGDPSIYVTLEELPAVHSPVVVATSEADCASKFVIENQPTDTELVWENGKIILRTMTTEITTWEELQSALYRGGFEQPDGTFAIQLTQDITAESSDIALLFAYTKHPVTLDLNGYKINRALTSSTENGYVMRVNSGELKITGISGSIYGGNNGGDSRGGGLYIKGGSVIMAGDVNIGRANSPAPGERNIAHYGAGVYVDNGASFTMEGGSVELNNGLIGSGVYVNGGSFTMNRGHISINTDQGGVVYATNGGHIELVGGRIEQNISETPAYSWIAFDPSSTVTLARSDDDVSLTLNDFIRLSDGQFITINSPFKDGDTIRIAAGTPTSGQPVKIAESAQDCREYLVIENQPENTKLSWENGVIYLRDEADIATWTELQTALNNGGTAGTEETYTVRLDADVIAGDGDSALTFGFEDHDVLLDLNGHTINRNLTAPAENGNVLTVSAGKLIICDNTAAKTGSITGGYNSVAGGGVVVTGGSLFVNDVSITGNTSNSADENKSKNSGGGVYVGGGSFTLESGSITGNYAENSGGGVYVGGGSVILLGGSITGNTAYSIAGINLENEGALTLSGSAVPIVTDPIYLRTGKTIMLIGRPASGSNIHVDVQSRPIFGSPVIIAESDLDMDKWKDCFTVEEQITNTDLVWAESKLIYQVKPEVSDWEGLGYALSIGGALDYTEGEPVRLIRLANDITAGSTHNVLTFNYTEAPVILDLNGHKIDRNLKNYDQHGNVLNVYGGELILRDSVGGGQITGGFGHECGGIYVDEGTLTMEGGSITGNTGAAYGGVYVRDGAALNLKGGSISGNTAARNDNPEKYAGGYVDALAAAKLYGDSVVTVTDSLNLHEDGRIQVVSAPAEGSQVYVSLHRDPTIENPVVFAESPADYSSVFHMANQPANTEIVYDGGEIKLVTEGVKSWTALQEALSSGGVQVGNEYWIQLGADIVAEPNNDRLVMENVAHSVILDLNGHTIDRHLSTATENGNVLTVYYNFGDLILRDSSTAKTGTITGGYNTTDGGGICVLGGGFTMEGGSITGNRSESNGGGVYLTENEGHFTLQSGSITGNHSAAKGGGAYVEGAGVFNLSGGRITGNTADDALGGGVYVSSSYINLSGSPVVTDNGSSNVYAFNIWMTNAGLTQGASIGVGTNLVGRFAGDIPYSEGIEIFTADTGFRLYEDRGGCVSIEPEGHEAEAEPRWVWSDDLTTATATMHCKNCGQMIWTASNIPVTFEYDTTAKKLYAKASVERDSKSYLGRLELHPLRVEEQQPRIDENKVYHSGTKAHYKLNVVNKTYYFTEVDGHPGAKCTEESVRLDMFKFVQQDASWGIAQYTGSFNETGTTYIRLPGAIENPAHPDNPEDAFALTFLGNGTDAFYTPTSANGLAEIMDYGTITNISANAFAGIQNLTLKLRAYNKSITIADSAFVNGANVKIIAYSTSNLGKGEHQQGTGESAGKYTVEFVDEPSYTVTADWAEDYSSAQITITDETGAITHTFPATNITRIETETEDPQTQEKTYTLSIKAEGIYEGETYSVELNKVPFFNVTVQGTEGILRMPKVRNADNTGYTDYAVFTVKQDMLDPLNPPAGAVLAGLYDGIRIYGVGTRVEIRRDTDFTAGLRSTWARVQAALNAGGAPQVTLYSDITPAEEGDSYLHVPQGVTATLNLGDYTVNRGLSTAAANGYVIRVDGSLTLNNGTVTGGNNTGDGGGIYLFDGGSLITNNVTVSSNHAQNGGGVYMVDVSQAEFNNSTISYNVANQSGGGLYVGGERPSSNSGLLGDPSGSTNTKLLNVSIVNNRAQNAGGLFVNSGEVQLGSNTKIINNTDLNGGKFNNIDVVGGIMNLISGADGLLLGLPIAGSVSSLKGWALGLLGALAAAGILAAVVSDRDKTSSDDDQEKECQPHILRCELKWADDYSSVNEYVRCSECGKILEINDLEPIISIDDDMYTHYKVKPSQQTEDDERVVPPYKLVKQANIPAAIDTTDTAGDFIDDVKFIPHGKGQAHTEVLGPSPWQFVENGDKLLFDGWLCNNARVAQVTFTGPDDQTITVQVHWLLPYGYAPHDSVPHDAVEDPAKGDHPLTPDTNPKYVESGAQETVKENQWTRLLYKFTAWRVPLSVKIVKEGLRYKLVYTYVEIDSSEIEDKKKPGDQLRITGPVILRAEWQSKWKNLDETLNKTASFPMTEPIFATPIDQTIKIKEGHTSALSLDSMMLNRADAPGVQSILNVLGILTIMDPLSTGMITGGYTTSNGGGITVGSDGTLILQGGNIVSNEAKMLNDKTGNGGGVSVSGNFIMSGGSVQNNTAGGNGGGVYVADKAAFAMSGGEISGNRAGINDQNAKGGGVYVGGSFSVSGKVIIKDNKVGVNASNVYLPTGKTITVSGKLDDAAEIHVSMQTPGVITSGLNAKGGNQANGKAENFVSDDDRYLVFINSQGEAELTDKPIFDVARLELGGILNMRFYMDYPKSWNPSSDMMVFTLNNKDRLEIPYENHETEGDEIYFDCPVNAYRMADTIRAEYYHDSELITSQEYSVKEYLDTLVGSGDSSGILARATANYGHYIQPYLANTNGWTVGQEYAAMPAYSEIVPSGNPASDYSYEFKKTQDYADYVARTDYYLTLDAGTALRVRVRLKDAGTVTAMVNYFTVDAVKTGKNTWVITVPDVPANMLDDQYLFSCFVDGHRVFDFNVSALSYVNMALRHENSPIVKQKALTALYEYAMAAKRYAPAE